MANEDVVWVDVLPSLSGFSTALRKGLSSVGVDSGNIGRAAGASFGNGFSTGAESGLRAAQDRVQAVEKRLADAKGALTVAQTRLTDAQAKGTTSAGTLAAAQERVEKAARNVALQETSLVRARQDATVAEKASTESAKSHTSALVTQNEETKKAPGLVEKFSTGWIKAAAVLGTVTYAAYGIKQAFGALYSTIDVASSMNEEVNKSKVVFGDASASVIAFAQNAARGMGESRLEALQSTGIFGNLFRAVGLTTDKSAEMSTKLVQLASDLASFNNADPSEVLLAMRAGLVGESEPMRRFGVDLSDLALRQEALNLGIYDGTGVLNQSQKAQAAYSLLLKQTSLAQGDFTRTSAGLANSTRILHAEWEDLKGALGGLLLGPATGVVHWLNDLLPRIQTNVEGLHRFGQAFSDGFNQINSVSQSTGTLGIFQALGSAVRDTTDWLRSLADMVTGAFRAGLQTAGSELTGLGGTFNNLVGTLTVVSGHWHELITTVVQAFLPVIRQLVPVVAELAAAFATVLGQALQAVVPVLSVIADAAGQVGTALADSLLAILVQLRPVIPDLAQSLGEVATVLGHAVLDVVKALAPVLATLAQSFGQVAQILAGAVLSVLQALEPVLPVLAKAFADIATAVAGALSDALGALAPILPVLARAFADIATAVGGALAQAVSTLAPILPPLVEAFVRLLQSAVQPLLPLLPTLAHIFGDIVGAVAPLIPAAAEIAAAFAHMATGILPALNPLLSFVANVVSTLAKAFEALPGPLQAVVGAFAVLKATLGINIFSVVADGLAGLGAAFQNTSARITGVVGGMTTAVKGELASLTGSFAAAKLAQQELVASNFGLGSQAVPKAIGDLAGLRGAASTVASQGFGLIKSAGAGLVGFFGGPWGLAIAGVTIGLSALIGWLGQESEATKKAKAATQEWKDALAAANGVIDESTRHAAALALEHAGVLETAQRLGIALPTMVDAVTGEGDAYENVKQKLRDYIEAHTTSVSVMNGGRGAIAGTRQALDDQGRAAQDALTALEGLNGATGETETAQGRVAQATNDAATAQRNQNQAIQDYITVQIGQANAVLGYQSALLNAQSSIERYNQGVADGTLTGIARSQAEVALAQSITNTIEQAGRAAAQALGPNADASAKAQAYTAAERAAFEQLVGMLGFVPPSLQSVADSLGVTTASFQDHKNDGVDPVAQAMGDLALSTIQGTLLPIFGQIPGALQPVTDALNAQALGVLPTNAAAWGVWAHGVVADILGAFGLGGSIPGAVGQTNGALDGQVAPGGPLDSNGQAWHDYLGGILPGAFNTFGASGVPGAVGQTNEALYFQAGPGGPLVLNQTAWHLYLQSVLGPVLGAFGIGGTIPGALSGTDGALYSQAAPGGPLVLNQNAWHTYVAGITNDILGLFGFGGTGGTLPGSLQNSGIQLDAFTTNATGDLGVVGAAFTSMAGVATAQMGVVEAHIAGPMTTSLASFAATATTSTNVVNAAFTTMQQTTTARMTDVENHIYGPMTTALAAFATQAINNDNVVNASFNTMRDTTSARMVDVENHIYGPMSSALATLNSNTANMSAGVQNSFVQMAAGAINSSALAANGISAAFDRIRAGVANPVNFVVSRVIGGSLIPAFNNVAAAVGIGGISVGLPTVALAEGGQIPGPYIGPKADNVPGLISFGNGGVAPVRLNPREFVQPVASVDKYGLGFMEAVRTGAFPTSVARAFAEGGSIPGFAQGGMTYPTLEAWVAANLPGAVITSAYRPGANDYHGLGDAVDISYAGNPQSKNMPAAAKIAASFGGITELIHNPNASIKNGAVVPPSFWGAATWAEHASHVHWAMTPSALAGGGAPVGLPAGITINGQLVTSSAQVQAMLDNAIGGPLGQLSAQFGNTQLTRYLGDFTHSLTNRVFGAIKGRVDAAIAAAAAAAAAAASAGTVASGPVKDQVASVFGTRGWGSGAQWSAVDNIVSRESGWNPSAQNPSSTASGLFQEIDATWRAYRRASAAGYPHMKNAPVPEQGWGGLNYIASRYGSPSAAWAFWQAHHYYDDGGILGDGMSGSNASGFDERVLSPRQTVAFERLVNVLDRNGGAGVTGGPSHFEGNLYLDSGEFMGKVHGVAVAVLDRRDEFDARGLRSA